MRRLSRDTWLTLGILGVLIIVTSVGAVEQARRQQLPSFTSYSSAPDGVRALNLWLQELSYDVKNITYENFRLPSDVGLIFILEPISSLEEGHLELLDEWVEDGGTLVLAGERTNALLAARHYEFELAFLSRAQEEMTQQSALFQSPALDGTVYGPATAYWRTERTDFVVHAAVGARPIVVSFELGDGRVFLSASPYPFSNYGLKQAGNPEMVLNMVSVADQELDIWFDEWHHGIRADSRTITGPWEWLRYSSIGQGILFAIGVIFVAVVVNGRHFGRPKPLLHEITRRTPLEYITAIANLNRRARHRENTMAQYRQWLKRDLGRRYRLDPTLPDDSYVRQMGEYRPDLDQEALLNLLRRLSKQKPTEEEMITAARETAEWLEKIG